MEHEQKGQREKESKIRRGRRRWERSKAGNNERRLKKESKLGNRLKMK